MVGYEYSDYMTYKSLEIGSTYEFKNVVSKQVSNAIGKTNMRSKYLKWKKHPAKRPEGVKPSSQQAQ